MHETPALGPVHQQPSRYPLQVATRCHGEASNLLRVAKPSDLPGLEQGKTSRLLHEEQSMLTFTSGAMTAGAKTFAMSAGATA